MPVLSDDREGVGLSVGVGVRVGVAVGVGVGVARWACADVDASANAKAIATVIATQLPAPGFPVREGLEEPRINIIPTRSAAQQKILKSRSAKADLRPVLRERQSVMVQGGNRLLSNVVPLPQVATSRKRPTHAPRNLLRRKFRVAISGAIGFRPFDCAFRD
jgi:hypothetical protein